MSNDFNSANSSQRMERLLLGVIAVSYLGDGVSAAAMVWLLGEIHSSALFLSILGSVMIAPSFFLSGAAGGLVDRSRRSTVISLSLMMRAAVLTAIAATAVLRDKMSDVTVQALILLAALVFGCFELLGTTAFTALVPAVVPNVRLASMNGRIFALRAGLKQTLGLPAGGQFVEISGAATAFIFDAATFVVATLTIKATSIASRGEATAPKPKSRPEPLQRGLIRFVHGAGEVRAVMYPLAFSSVLTAMAYFQIALFVRDVAGNEPLVMSLVLASSPAGLITGGIIVSRIVRRRSARSAAGRADNGLGASMLFKGTALTSVAVFAAAPLATIAGLFLAGVATSISTSLARGYLQQAVEYSRQGTLAAATGWFTYAITPVVAIPTAALFSAMNLPVKWMFLIAGVGSVYVGFRGRMLAKP